MIDGLIAGKLLGSPERRTDKNGKPFVVAKVIAAAGEGEGIIVNVIAFDATTGQTLLDLQDGDSLALTGALTPRVWTDKQGAVRPSLDLVAHRILSARDVQLERKYPSGEAK
jgi:single-stranded DNA-binding protein